MDTIFATLACCLLALSFTAAQTENRNVTIAPPTTTAALNLTQVPTALTSSNSTVHATVVSNVTEETTSYTSTNLDNGTAPTTESTSHTQTSQSATTSTPLTNSTSPKTTTASSQPPTFTALTTQTIQTTAGHISTPDTSVTPTEHSSHTVSATTDSTQGLRLSMSEKIMTIVFSVVLGLFALALVIIMLHKCKHKTQYFIQPLNNTDDTGAFMADDDTLVISGGLYDGHPIYDNVPAASEDQSQFRLEFLH